jgi:hypothetical protein
LNEPQASLEAGQSLRQRQNGGLWASLSVSKSRDRRHDVMLVGGVAC